MILAQFNARQRRFLLLTLGFVELFVISLAASMYYVDAHHPTGTPLYEISAGLAILLLIALGFVVRWISVEMDEFQRSVLVRALLWGLAGTVAICGVWMVLERSAGVAHMSAFTIPLVFLFSSLAAKLILKLGYR